MYLNVSDICSESIPSVAPSDSINTVILEITSNRLGATMVIDKGDIIGIITDGDLRRMIQSNPTFQDLTAKDIMSSSPKTIEYNQLATEALHLMKTYNITQLAIMKSNQYFGIIHIHDILKEGI